MPPLQANRDACIADRLDAITEQLATVVQLLHDLITAARDLPAHRPVRDPPQDHILSRATNLITNLQNLHRTTQQNLEVANARYKSAADTRRKDVQFNVGDYVWAVLTKDIFPPHEYNKLASRKIGPVEIIEKINPNAYRLRLPSHVRTADVFNVKHLVPYDGDNSSGDEAGSDSRANRSKDGENDGDEVAALFLKKTDRLGLDKIKSRI